MEKYGEEDIGTIANVESRLSNSSKLSDGTVIGRMRRLDND